MERNSITFRTHLKASENHIRLRAPHGGKEVKTYHPVYDHRGVWHLEESGVKNLYLEIQSHADSCDLNVIMARYKNGETDVLKQVQGFFGDFTDFPKNYAAVMNMALRAEEMFYGLPADVREKYNNSVEQFMSAFGEREAWRDLGFKFKDEMSVEPPAPSSEKEGATE